MRDTSLSVESMGVALATVNENSPLTQPPRRVPPRERAAVQFLVLALSLGERVPEVRGRVRGYFAAQSSRTGSV
jgi:hypothetical protein